MAHLQIDGLYAYVEITVPGATLDDHITWLDNGSLDKQITSFRGDPTKETALLAISDAIIDHRFLSLNGSDITDYYVSENDTLRDDAYLDRIRAKMGLLLKKYDWTQMSDSPLDAPTKQSWLDYRQLLRDMPADPSLDLVNTVWPTPPS